MVGGLLLAAIPLLGNAASVMFTFYPPLEERTRVFYVGLTLGRRRHLAGDAEPGLHAARLARPRTSRASGRHSRPSWRWSPFAMWSIASLGIAAEMLFLLIPW